MNQNINVMKEKLIYLSLKYPDLLNLIFQFQPNIELLQEVKDWIQIFEKENSNMKNINILKEKLKEIDIKFPQYLEDYWMIKISSNLKEYKHSPLHVKQNKNILKYILNKIPTFLRFSDHSLRGNPEIIEMLIKYPKITFKAFKYFHESYRIKYAEKFVLIHPNCFKSVPLMAKTKELVIKMYESTPNYQLNHRISSFIPRDFFKDLEFLKFMLKTKKISLYEIPYNIFRNFPKDLLLDFLSENVHQYQYLGIFDDRRYDEDVLRTVIQNTPFMFSYFDKHVKRSSRLSQFLFEVNPLIFPHLSPIFQSEERCKTFLQIRNFHKFSNFQFSNISKEISGNKELYKFGLNESIENLILFSPTNEKYFEFIVKHLNFTKMIFLETQRSQIFNDYYFTIFNSMKDLLVTKIFMMNPIYFTPLNFIEFKEEEAEILFEIYMTLKRMYVELSFRTSKKVSILDDIQFIFN
jgi:hypothetical protein